MQEIEKSFHDDAYGGLKAREARLKERHDVYVQNREAEEIRRIAQLKLIEKGDDDYADANPRARRAHSAHDTPDLILGEIEDLTASLPAMSRVSVVARTAQVELQETPYRRLTAKLQFPEDYPAGALAVHLQSPALSPDLLDKLAASTTAAAVAHRGSPHAAYATDLLSKFITTNRLAPAYDDLAQLRTYFAEASTPSARSAHSSSAAGKDVSVVHFAIQHAKQACGEVAVVLCAGEYYMHVRAVVPRGYPEEPLGIEVTESNLPEALVRVDAIKATEVAAAAAEFRTPETDVLAAGARAGAGVAAASRAERLAREGKQTVTSFNKGQGLAHAAKERAEATWARRAREAAEFVPQPSLFRCVRHLAEAALLPLAAGHCAVCCKRLLPSDPRKLPKVPKSMQVLKAYCGHCYHFKCIERYLSEPPFGKGCHTCGVPIEHHSLTTDAHVLEARWAAQQAKQRELDEIADFLS
eukprot:jgi/Ulvmu1/9944/UM058_0027.1